MVRISCIEAQDAFGLLLNHTGEKDNQVSHTHTHTWSSCSLMWRRKRRTHWMLRHS